MHGAQVCQRQGRPGALPNTSTTLLFLQSISLNPFAVSGSANACVGWGGAHRVNYLQYHETPSRPVTLRCVPVYHKHAPAISGIVSTARTG
jgi:hypothetical protein